MSKNNVKSRNFAFVLYPDNPYHMQYLSYIENTFDGFYILHEKNADNYNLPIPAFEYTHHEEKAHYHVVVRFKNPRSLSGVVKSIPNVKYYQALPLENIDEKTKSRFYTVYDVSYIDIPVQEVYKPVVEHIEAVTDIYGYAQYCLHKDFDSFVKGKKQYGLADVRPLNCDISAISDYFDVTKQTDNDLLDCVMQICACANGDKNLFVQLVQMHTNPLVLKYVQKNAYFIDKYVLAPNRLLCEMEETF